MLDANQILIFDRTLVRQRRDRAAMSFAVHSVLFEEIAAQIIERLGDVTRDFEVVLDLGAHTGLLSRRLTERRTRLVVAADISEKMVRQSLSLPIVADEEFVPFAARSFDLIISNLSLHWINDLPGALLQMRKTLRPDGLFMATMLGGNTLHELRTCLLEAELAMTGGGSPRFSPTVDLRDASALLQRAGFVLPVADQETLTLTYPDIFALMRDLRGMGETNAQRHRHRRFTRRAIFLEAARLYQSRFAGSDGLIPATFEIFFLHGWAPSA